MFFGVASILSSELVFQFEGGDGDAVEGKDKIDGVFIFLAVVNLTGDGETVLVIEGDGIGV